MSRRVSDLQLERFLAQALTPAEQAELEALLATSPDDQQALASLRADTAALFVKRPPEAFAHQLAPSPPRTWRWAAALGAALAMLAVAVSVVRTHDDDLRTKGGAAWRVTVAHGQALQVAREHTVVHEGDVLSFEVTTSAKAYAAVISHAPDGFQVYAKGSGTGQAEPLGAGVTTLHDGAQLDATQGDEVLYLLVSPQQFDPAEAKRALEADPGLRQWQSVVIERRALKKE
jgi:hypothetical protein